MKNINKVITKNIVKRANKIQIKLKIINKSKLKDKNNLKKFYQNKSKLKRKIKQNNRIKISCKFLKTGYFKRILNLQNKL